MAHYLKVNGEEYRVSWRHLVPKEGDSYIKIGRHKRHGETTCFLVPVMCSEEPGALVSVQASVACSMNERFSKAEGRIRSLMRTGALLMQHTEFTVNG